MRATASTPDGSSLSAYLHVELSCLLLWALDGGCFSYRISKRPEFFFLIYSCTLVSASPSIVKTNFQALSDSHQAAYFWKLGYLPASFIGLACTISVPRSF